MHDVKLLSQAEPASLGACLVGVRPGQELPLDVEVEALVFQAPDVACQPGSDPFVGVSEVVSVVVVLVRLMTNHKFFHSLVTALALHFFPPPDCNF